MEHSIVAVVAIILFVLAAGFNDNRYGWIGLAILALLVVL